MSRTSANDAPAEASTSDRIINITANTQPLTLPSTASKLLRTAWSIIDGYNAWDLDAILAPRTSNCTQKVFPLSLQGPTYASPDAYREYYTKMIPLFKNFKLDVLDYAEDQARNRVFFHTKCAGETDVGPYANEYVWMVRTTEDHGKVEDIKEFIDSAYTVEYLTRMKKATDEKGDKTWG